MRSRNWISWFTVLALAAFGAAAHAGPVAVPVASDPTPVPPAPRSLPSGPRSAPAALIGAARNQPAARMAVARMEANGYARTPEFDAARAQDGRAVVALAFSDPANPEFAPIVIVATEESGATRRTWVAGGVFRVDPVTEQVALADDAPEASQFIVNVPEPGASGPGTLAPTGSGPRSLRDWAACSFIGCGAVYAGCIRMGALLPIPPQARAGCVIAGCGVLSFICIW